MLDDDGLGASIGSGLDYAAHLEFGTMDMPARPFLFPAMWRSRRAIRDIVEQVAFDAMRIQRTRSAKSEVQRGLDEFETYKQAIEFNFDAPEPPPFDLLFALRESLKELSRPGGPSDIGTLPPR